MKTIEEKAKAYDEALERAQKATRAGSDVAMDIVQYIFPELRESEDERIRKGLIQHLKELRDWKCDTMPPIKVPSHYDAWIAYLERQKEPTEGDFARGYDSGYEACLNSHGAEWLEKQEQKCAWSEEDEDAVRHICRYLGYHCNEATARGCTEWLNVRLKSLRPQPSWKPSKEQMKGLKFFLDFHRPQRNAGTTAWKEFDSVDSLYNDLLKLK